MSINFSNSLPALPYQVTDVGSGDFFKGVELVLTFAKAGFFCLTCVIHSLQTLAAFFCVVSNDLLDEVDEEKRSSLHPTL